jgi:hypothetical protein
MRGRITSMKFPVMSRASAKRARVSTGSVAPPQEPWRARSRPAPGCAAQAANRLRPQGAAQPAPTRTPVPGRASRHASRVIAAGTPRWSHPYRPCPRRALANRYEQAPAVNDGSLRSVLTWRSASEQERPSPRQCLPSSGPLGPHRGHIRATNDWITADKTGNHRPTICLVRRPSMGRRRRSPRPSRDL